MKHKGLWIIIPCLLQGTLVRPALAEETPGYRVELLIFRNTDPAQEASEVWPLDRGEPDLEGALPLSGSSARDLAAEHRSPFVPLNRSEFQLMEAHRRLAQSSPYEPILHLAWRQPVQRARKATKVYIRTPAELTVPKKPKAYGARESENTRRWDGTPADSPQEKTLARTEAEARLPRLEGAIKVSVARYLHMDVDVVYRWVRRLAPPQSDDAETQQGFRIIDDDQPEPSTIRGQREPPSPSNPKSFVEGGTENEVQSIRLQQQRRMSSGELHYFDHPLLGILALITPYKSPSKAPEQATDTTEAPADSSQRTR